MALTDTSRVLVFSYRNIFKTAMFRCPHYEFEDVISQTDSIDVLAPEASPSSFRFAVSKKVAYHSPFTFNPGVKRAQPTRSYDMFFAICGQPSDLIAVDAAIDFKRHCGVSVCLVDEFWKSMIAKSESLFRLLAKFDVVVFYYSQTVKPVSEKIGSKCIFLPPGVDAIKFNPFPDTPERAIDVLSIGRRSEATHQKLLQLAQSDGIFYLHDSIAGGNAIHSSQHRALFANLAKRSKYFLVNPGCIDNPEVRGDQIEIGNRYFEGAASGTIMLGEIPNADSFRTHFDWTDALIDLPYNSTEIGTVISEMNAQPERIERIRRMNVRQALLRHDWVHRWEAILAAAGIEALPQLQERKERLKALADQVAIESDLRSAKPAKQALAESRI